MYLLVKPGSLAPGTTLYHTWQLWEQIPQKLFWTDSSIVWRDHDLT